MEAALGHTARFVSSRYTYHQAYPSPLRLSHSYLRDVSQPHASLLQQYLSYYHEPLAPLDLSIKPTPITPPCTPPLQKNKFKILDHSSEKPAKIFRHFTEETESEPANTAEKRKLEDEPSEDSPEEKKLKFTKQFFDDLNKSLNKDFETPTKDKDPNDVIEIKDIEERPKKPSPKPHTPHKKNKAVRRLTFDEDKTSPVSGTIIRDLEEDETLVVRKGDIDPAFNVVEVTEEAKALIASIENRLGSYICRLCRRLYADAFALAQHRCSRIVHIEYRCPECDKVFNCPANLASHRRWHKPRVPAAAKPRRPDPPLSGEAGRFTCQVCGKLFRRQAYLKKHQAAHDSAPERPDVSDLDARDRFPEKDERSAFHQVTSDFYREPHSDFSTLWSKVTPLGEPYYESGVEGVGSSYGSHSEDSRSLDVTGSDDEGSGGGVGGREGG